MPSLSIIVTTFNVAPYIDKCLQGIVNQKLHDIEIIVVDDGSTDNTREHIDRFAERDDRIRCIYLEENTVGGVASAANIGIQEAKGEYIGFADGDDVYEPTMFGKLVSEAQRHDADIAFCNYSLLDDRSGKLTEPADERRWTEIGFSGVMDLGIEERQKLLPFIPVPWRKIYRRDLLGSEIRFPVGDFFFEDNPFHWFVILTAKRAAFINERLCFHRVGREGQSMATVDSRLFKIFEHHTTIYNWLSEKGLLDEYKLTLLNWIFAQMSWVSRRCPTELRDELFLTLRKETRYYTGQDAAAAMELGMMGRTNARMVLALFANNPRQFFSIVDQTAKYGPIEKVYYHYRRYGVVRLFNTTAEYLWKGFEARRQAKADRMDNIIAGLRIIDDRLRRIEKKIDRLQK